MQYYKDSKNNVYSYDDDYDGDLILESFVKITYEEAMDIVNPPKTNEEMLSIELSSLGVKYKDDIYELNTSYLAAIVSDGPSEITKQQVVRDQITQRKAQYVADIAAAKEKYPI
ncbi:TPA: hypothetical protein N2F56_000895 [Salmonella enterica]|nr:hypothetical protein [Salmonella enterica]HCL5080530.1 hypothetical protein [Salmonella enterica]